MSNGENAGLGTYTIPLPELVIIPVTFTLNLPTQSLDYHTKKLSVTLIAKLTLSL